MSLPDFWTINSSYLSLQVIQDQPPMFLFIFFHVFNINHAADVCQLFAADCVFLSEVNSSSTTISWWLFSPRCLWGEGEVKFNDLFFSRWHVFFSSEKDSLRIRWYFLRKGEIPYNPILMPTSGESTMKCWVCRRKGSLPLEPRNEPHSSLLSVEFRLVYRDPYFMVYEIITI